MPCKAALCLAVSYQKVTIDYLGSLPFLILFFPYLTSFFLISCWFTFICYLNISRFLSCIPFSCTCFGILLLIASLLSTTLLPLALSLISLYPFSNILSLLSMILQTRLLSHTSNLTDNEYNFLIISFSSQKQSRGFHLFFLRLPLFLPTAVQTVH